MMLYDDQTVKYIYETPVELSIFYYLL